MQTSAVPASIRSARSQRLLTRGWRQIGARGPPEKPWPCAVSAKGSVWCCRLLLHSVQRFPFSASALFGDAERMQHRRRAAYNETNCRRLVKIIARACTVVILLPITVSAIWLEDSIVFLASLAAGALAVVAAIVTVVVGRRSRKIVAAALCALPLSLAGITSVAIWNWPLRLAFIISQPALEELAADVTNGRVITNKRAGLFFIQRAELVRAGIPCLWVDTDPAARTGFVETRTAVLPFNLWSVISLSEQWQLISED